jgi:hypothetical protein
LGTQLRLDVRKESLDAAVQRLGNRKDVFERDVSLASLYAAHVCTMQSRSIGEFFLGEAPIPANLPDV